MAFLEGAILLPEHVGVVVIVLGEVVVVGRDKGRVGARAIELRCLVVLRVIVDIALVVLVEHLLGRVCALGLERCRVGCRCR